MSSPPPVPAGALPAVARRRRGVIGRGLEPFFRKVEVEPETLARLRRAHEEGVVVHCLRSSRVVDPLFIRSELARHHLPLPEWMHDHYASDHPPTLASFLEEVSAGHPTLLFLRRPRTIMISRPAYSEPFVQSLLDLQRNTARPILLLPEALIWGRRAQELRRGWFDSVFGDRESPGKVRELAGFVQHHADARYHVGAPIDLQEALRREEGTPDRVVAKKIRWMILNHLAREEQLRTGPVHRPASRTRQAVKNDPAVRKLVDTMTSRGASRATVERKVDDILKRTAADLRTGWLGFLDGVVDLIWNRIYDGIVVDESGFSKLRAAARKGPVVVVPSHRSHVDYIVLSQVFFKEGMVPPHIAAGENLNFWPLGPVFRRSGAFFIRRSFRGDKLYAAVFSAYVRRLMKEGHAIEFFIEGGRSRTGLLLAPRLGMLSICLEPVFDGAIEDVSFVPVSISYEKIIEARAYARELAGEQKKKEDVGALLTSGPKVLRSRYGRVYVDFDDPISVRELAASRGTPLTSGPEAESGDRTKKLLAKQLGHRIVYGINQVTRVTPSSVIATIFLATHRSELTETELFESADRLMEFLETQGARTSSSLQAHTGREGLREVLALFARDGAVQTLPGPDGELAYRITSSGRVALSYYRNTILHFFVPAAIVAMALIASTTTEELDTEVRRRALRLSRLLKFDVSFRDDAFDENFEAAMKLLVDRGIANESDGRWTVSAGPTSEARVLAAILTPVLDTHRRMAAWLAELGPRYLRQDAFLSACQAAAGEEKHRPEGATLPSLKSSLRFMVDAGIASKDDGRITVADETTRRRMVDELDGYLRAVDETRSAS